MFWLLSQEVWTENLKYNGAFGWTWSWTTNTTTPTSIEYASTFKSCIWDSTQDSCMSHIMGATSKTTASNWSEVSWRYSTWKNWGAFIWGKQSISTLVVCDTLVVRQKHQCVDTRWEPLALHQPRGFQHGTLGCTKPENETLSALSTGPREASTIYWNRMY